MHTQRLPSIVIRNRQDWQCGVSIPFSARSAEVVGNPRTAELSGPKMSSTVAESEDPVNGERLD